MNSIKCKSCGLSNFPTDAECRRCGYSFVRARKKRQGRPRRFSIWSLLMIAGVLGVVYYFYTGVQNSMDQIQAEEATRIASQPPQTHSTPGLSRSQHDQQRAGHVGDAIRNSSGLQSHDQRTRETEKALEQVSNSR